MTAEISKPLTTSTTPRALQRSRGTMTAETSRRDLGNPAAELQRSRGTMTAEMLAS